MSRLVDLLYLTNQNPSLHDLTRICIRFIIRTALRQGFDTRESPLNPHSILIIGINGIQGAGKSTLTRNLKTILSNAPYNFEVITASIDDFYFPHDSLTQLVNMHTNNPLFHHRGNPGTHDMNMLFKSFNHLREGHATCLPRYDKTAHNGLGDRCDRKFWQQIDHVKPQSSLRLMIFEGWCIGFRPLGYEEVKKQWKRAKLMEESEPEKTFSKLSQCELQNVYDVDHALSSMGYTRIIDYLQAFIYLDVKDTRIVYQWRLQQEHELRRSSENNSGMTDEQVRKFIDHFYPSYELYLAQLRQGIFESNSPESFHRVREQLIIEISNDRSVISYRII